MTVSWRSFIFLFLMTVVSYASIDPEMDGLEVVSRDDGTFLVGSPTFYFDRRLGSAGIHSESEIWAPGKFRERLLFNRLSVLPSWKPFAPSVWMKTGNELGDMIYQDLITPEDRPDNRTPILEGGFRTPSYKGFWITARGFQDDHYSDGSKGYRGRFVEDEFALFGENYPFFSSGYAGLGFTNDAVDASLLVGEEYIWLYGESSRWIPVHFRPRVEAKVDVFDLKLTLGYESADYQNFKKKETGNRMEINGSVYYETNDVFEQLNLSLVMGLNFRALDDSGHVYTGLDENRVVWPFIAFRINPLQRLSVNASLGVNDEDWLVQDSVEYRVPVMPKSDVVLGVKNVSGTRLNPLADDEEYFDDEVISLNAEGQMNLLQSYAAFSDTMDYFGFGVRASYWAEHGAETFDTTRTVKEYGAVYRFGDVSRINSWIKGFTGEIWFGAWFMDMFSFKALTGIEKIDGPDERFEVTPSEFFASFSADWLLQKSFRISHSLRYRSDAKWNLRSRNPLEVKGDWYWDATFEQMFPKQGLYLTGTILHVLADETLQVPNAGYDRLRFVCTVKKTF